MDARIWVVFFSMAMVLALTTSTASAGGASEVRKQAEASMLLSGSVEVAPDGTLRSYQLDQPEKIDPAIRDLVDRNIKSWSFAIDSLPPGVSANATILNTMSILVVAKPLDDDTYNLRLAASHFSPTKPTPGTQVSFKDNTAPAYPAQAVRAGVTGKVYLLIKVGLDGTVEDAIAEQVNLGVAARNEGEMEKWRKVLADSALKAARRWTFTVPSQDDRVRQPYFVVRAPVEYAFNQKNEIAYGQWVPYVPGPRHPNPWQETDHDPGFAPDALAANGGVYSNDGLRLKSPLHGVADGS